MSDKITSYPTPDYIREAFHQADTLDREKGYMSPGAKPETYVDERPNLSSLATKLLQYTGRFVQSNVLNALRLWRIVEELSSYETCRPGEDSIILFALRKDGVDDVFEFEHRLIFTPWASEGKGSHINIYPLRVYRALLAVRVRMDEESEVDVEMRELTQEVMKVETFVAKGAIYLMGRTFTLCPDVQSGQHAITPDILHTLDVAGKNRGLLANLYIPTKVFGRETLSVGIDEKYEFMLETIAQPIIENVGRLAERYASDFFISWTSMMNALRCANDGDDLVFMFAIRDYGVDHMSFFKSKMSEAGKRQRSTRTSPSGIYRKVFVVRALMNTGMAAVTLQDVTTELFDVDKF